MKITVNGKEYDSWDQVPAELRETIRKAGLFGGHTGVIPPLPGPPAAPTQQLPQRPAYPPQQPFQQPQQTYQEQPQASDGMVTLNGQPYDPNQPEKKRRWWNRKG
ncbi:MAG: hypothetical protein ACR2KJ_12465 [Jatrophihabitans sp.]